MARKTHLNPQVKEMHRSATIIITLILTLSAISSQAADLEALKAECDSCHGPAGVSPYADVPIIAGQTPGFIAKTLRGFQLWDRPCVKTTYRSGPKAGTEIDMCEKAGALGEDDIAAISDWYGSQVFVPATQEFDQALAAAGKTLHEENCEKCHAEGGALAGKEPRLAGQWMEYLHSTMQYVPTGERLCPRLMENKVNEISAEGLKQLLHYYASQQD
jgi:sulfide dehydrogenase cytochrome subunit